MWQLIDASFAISIAWERISSAALCRLHGAMDQKAFRAWASSRPFPRPLVLGVREVLFEVLLSLLEALDHQLRWNRCIEDKARPLDIAASACNTSREPQQWWFKGQSPKFPLPQNTYYFVRPWHQ